MEGGYAIIRFVVLLVLFGIGGGSEAGGESDEKVYIVYMGGADGSLGNELVASVTRRKENGVVHKYKHGFSGFAARLSKEQAAEIAMKEGVVSVFADPLLKLHTTRSWDFLTYQTQVIIDDDDHHHHSSSDTIIGILDTGIWPEAPSFGDKDMGPLPSRWKGTCMNSQDFNSSNCNRKIIGARFYANDDDDTDSSARDSIGHGSHVASTAAGCSVSDASYYGLAPGSAKGGSPSSSLAVYKVCSNFGCRGSAILAAFDDAIADGVDILSLSLGSPATFRPQLTSDPIAIGAFHAVQSGITVVCSAGNDGPASNTVVNDAPWILTVAATTIDRDFQSHLLLPGNKVIKGQGIHFSNLSTSPQYPLVYGESATTGSANLAEARLCHPGSLDGSKVKGKIVVCDGKNDVYSTSEKIETVKESGGIGMVHVQDQSRAVASSYGAFPATVINSKDALPLFQYLNSTSKPTATILATVSVSNYKPAPQVAYFSSRGPSTLSNNILKPDIAAPGVEILAAWTGKEGAEDVPEGKKASPFNLISGTSMACPHVSGVAANVKSRNPTWTPSAIKSAIMTCATQNNNLKAPITTDSGSLATPYDYGAGEVTTSGPLQPGLVYETTTTDYLNYLCYIGLNLSTIKLISTTLPSTFACPKDSSSDHVSNINYPSISIHISNLKTYTVTRTVTNVGEDEEALYSSLVDAPSGVDVKLNPDKLQFTNTTNKLSYEVTFSIASLNEAPVFGTITWTNAKHTVQSPFVLTN
ncbi:CO(2)-response secreted protease [Senna tora]|uniref:CO(2)-response secreted protease n=1 Tax=Senna tora TaxID=362788 RepID=A0A834T9Q3_9FABA|nr:CO(2)-response secreted protease [Senna tora]